ncbi:hypothetical protein Misp01_32570 [Microtetraspora sp. NBRC 13810]|nr:hypothetical protein Misp01_32570 [Microtetraspora sp. NBRC 13810]
MSAVRRLLAVVAFAGASALLGAAPALADPYPPGTVPPLPVPAGYVFESRVVGSPACSARGEQGRSEGRWVAYVCRAAPHPILAPAFYWDLYVQR